MNDEYNDEHSGKGGSYVIDADGKRVPAPPAPAPVLPVQKKPTSQPKVKEASNA